MEKRKVKGKGGKRGKGRKRGEANRKAGGFYTYFLLVYVHSSDFFFFVFFVLHSIFYIYFF